MTRTNRRPGYNFAYLDEQTKRMIRRAMLKAVAMPGYQVPFGSREMPLPYGWGTGGIQVTAGAHRPRRHPQGHRPGRRRHHQRRLHPPVLRHAPPASRPPTRTEEATIIQTRHRIPETPLRDGQIMVYQVPHPRAAALAGAAGNRDPQACMRWPNTA